MRARIAEWILSLALPPEQAAAVVGDFTEDAARRGEIWFWSCVFRTLFARIWSDLTGNPLTMIRLGLSGFVRNIPVILGFQGAIFVLLLWPHPNDPFHGDIRYRHDWIWNTLMVNHAKNPAPPQLDLRWQIEMVWLILYWARLVQTARWLMRRAPGREFAACLSIVLTGWIAIVAPVVAVRNSANVTVHPEGFLFFIVNDIILCSAVVWMRRRSFPKMRMG